MIDKVLADVENKIVGNYDNDTIQRIIDYLQERHNKVQEQLEEEYIYDNYTGEELKIKLFEHKIKYVKTKEEMKKVVRELFSTTEIEDVDFSEFIYQDVIPKLEELGVVFDRENEIDYERVLKEEY